MASLNCNLCLNVAASTLFWTDPSLRYALHVAWTLGYQAKLFSCIVVQWFVYVFPFCPVRIRVSSFGRGGRFRPTLNRSLSSYFMHVVKRQTLMTSGQISHLCLSFWSPSDDHNGWQDLRHQELTNWYPFVFNVLERSVLLASAVSKHLPSMLQRGFVSRLEP